MYSQIADATQVQQARPRYGGLVHVECVDTGQVRKSGVRDAPLATGRHIKSVDAA